MSTLNLTDYPTGCVCLCAAEREDCGGCLCNDDERVIRARLYGKLSVPLSPEERQRMACDADACFKGERHYDELVRLDDLELCRETLASWLFMARKHGLV